MSKTYTLSQITARLGGQVRGADTAVSAVQPLDKAEAADISFLANPKYKHEVHASGAGAVIVSEKAAAEFEGRSLIVAADPYLYFAKVARLFSPVVKAAGGVHPTAVIEPSAAVPASCEIGANVYIGANTVLGEGCRILAGAVIEHDCTLGDETVVRANAVIYYGCTLGKRVEIHSGAVIGADGFGLAFAGDSWFKIPQTGAVTLGDDVEIGSNTNIDRGAMSDTTVGCGTKIDNQVQIGHNCKIGEHTVIAAKTGISGSVTIGNYCIIGGGVGTVGHIAIADKTTIGGGTSVTHSITESGTHVAGIFPMSSYRDWARNAVHIHRLNDTAKRIRQLEQQLAELKNGK
ncbi:UDP-3-O-[3-hydroxymyristoyl] glucosamine N-acyltransferase [Neisseria bacilliformis ATCC BAA-1200]|uniref:UDP-3-O-acylglucosamine N-acyltransferase n=1 Tax=Neisseria bacilliformis ATCC BAA-1200 TaxID=888742 RepID=F2BBT1_9NEIS|nr:UDP-3-O-(3-hydroxymyristoyl)glucosamine N-acyltransferase [Neisseria bacilliformis]EGF11097.1 UDP-3-O-[3-hydroxymyristoyl] glucosamine N-acyltransferase [Neisseria bacilliformis ATCC BAA-1200]QMT48253.1 UDP-3-O-(3-hydroxymyristoyl)glucosamine N-acyltransferase [Neisseria bacilliformis]